MALSGPEALRSLDDAIRDIRQEEADASKRVARGAERVTKIRENEAGLFRRLAKVRLEPEVQAEIEGRLLRAEREARKMLEDHAEKVSTAEKDIKVLDKQIADLARVRRDAVAEMDAQQEKLRSLSAEIAKAIASEPEYATQRENADRLSAVANESLKKTNQAEQDRETKGKPYRDDPLFMYLWESGYETRNYRANNLIRWVDSMVARMTGYQQARPNFAMLNDIPMRLREHTDRQMKLAEEAEARLDVLESKAIAKAGGGPVKQALEKAQLRIEQIDTEMVEAEDNRDKLTRLLTDMAEGRDPAFTAAVDNLARAMESQRDLSLLIAEARRTSTPQDDAILAQIDDARLRAVDEETETRELRDRLKVLATRRRELEDIEFEFKKSRFDDPRSTFRKDDLTGDLLSEFLKGAITASTYWGHWQRSQDWRAGTSDWGGGFGLPRGGRNSSWPTSMGSTNWGKLPGGSRGGSSGSGFSRPRTGSKGTRRHGGFKTGGSF